MFLANRVWERMITQYIFHLQIIFFIILRYSIEIEDRTKHICTFKRIIVEKIPTTQVKKYVERTSKVSKIPALILTLIKTVLLFK